MKCNKNSIFFFIPSLPVQSKKLKTLKTKIVFSFSKEKNACVDNAVLNDFIHDML